jgi:hypothetical protein
MLQQLAAAIRRIHEELRDAILQQCRAAGSDDLIQVAATDGAGDETFKIDTAAEKLLAPALERELLPLGVSMVALFEGQREPLVIPRGTLPDDAQFRSIWDPLDGSRALAYQLHSGWVLTSVAPNRGEETRLSDAVIAVQTEVPKLNQRTAVVLSGVRERPGQTPALRATVVDVQSGEERPLALAPSRSTTLAKGFIANEFYLDGHCELLAQMEDEIVLRAFGEAQEGEARVWRDTQLTSGGTLYNVLSGKVRWAHDFRPLLAETLAKQGKPMSLCAHPYDLSTAPLLCEALGVVLTNPLDGSRFDAPMTLTDNVAWSAYANAELAAKLRPIVSEVLKDS